jgi:molybdate transport system substrate-binding protein
MEGIVKTRCVIGAIAGLALLLSAVHADAAEISLFSSIALKSVLEDLGPQFEKATQNKLSLTLAPAAVVKAKIDQGAAFDVAILTVPLVDALVEAGKIDGTTRVIVARGGLGVAMRAGVPKPDVSTPQAFKRMLLSASSIGYNGQAASRAATEAVFAKLGIADDLKPKIKLLQMTTSEGVIRGEVEVALGPISDILASPGAELVGPFPSDLQWYLVLPAGVAIASKNADAAKALIKFLTSPEVAPVLKAKGMEPG